MVTILKLVTGAIPYNPSQGQHLHNVDVKRLEREANEALGDKMDGEDHKLKRDTLKELFKVARTAERYYNNEIGKDTYQQLSTKLTDFRRFGGGHCKEFP